MSDFFYCASCHQFLKRAFLNDGNQYCAQCISYSGQQEESDALVLVDIPVEEENVEVICEVLVVTS